MLEHFEKKTTLSYKKDVTRFWKHLEKVKKRKLLNSVSEIIKSFENYCSSEKLIEKDC